MRRLQLDKDVLHTQLGVWDKRGADPTNREYNIHITPESVGEISNVTPIAAPLTTRLPDAPLDFNDFLQP